MPKKRGNPNWGKPDDFYRMEYEKLVQAGKIPAR
jgi:hypothetical protein